MTTIKQIALTSAFVFGAGFLLNVDVAEAQREAPDRGERRDQRRQQMENLTPEQRRESFQQRRQERQRTMTPEQRQRFEERRQQWQAQGGGGQGGRDGGGFRGPQLSAEDSQRLLMQSAGVEDNTVQDAIMAFVAEQSRQRQPVTTAATQLSALLADTNSTPETIDQQLGTLRTASAGFRTWREEALLELDAQIGYTQNVRIQSLLVLVGILGDESTDAGGFNTIFPRGVAGTGEVGAVGGPPAPVVD